MESLSEGSRHVFRQSEQLVDLTASGKGELGRVTSTGESTRNCMRARMPHRIVTNGPYVHLTAAAPDRSSTSSIRSSSIISLITASSSSALQSLISGPFQSCCTKSQCLHLLANRNADLKAQGTTGVAGVRKLSPIDSFSCQVL